MILEVETPECWGHNFHVTVVGTGHVPQIKNSPKVSSRPDHYLLLAISPRETSKNEQQAKLPKMMDVKLTANSYRKFQLKMTNIISWNSFYSNTLPPLTLAFKTRLSANLCCENEFYLNEKRKKFISIIVIIIIIIIIIIMIIIINIK